VGEANVPIASKAILEDYKLVTALADAHLPSEGSF
jgi:hypothetical protein